jgi:hypothetical protein
MGVLELVSAFKASPELSLISNYKALRTYLSLINLFKAKLYASLKSAPFK